MEKISLIVAVLALTINISSAESSAQGRPLLPIMTNTEIKQSELRSIICTQLHDNPIVEDICQVETLLFKAVVTKFPTRFSLFNCSMADGPVETGERIHIVAVSIVTKEAYFITEHTDGFNRVFGNPLKLIKAEEDANAFVLEAIVLTRPSGGRFVLVASKEDLGPLVIVDKLRELQEPLKPMRMGWDQELRGYRGTAFLLRGRDLIRRDISVEESGVHFKDKLLVGNIVARY